MKPKQSFLKAVCVLILVLGGSASAGTITPDSNLISDLTKATPEPLFFNEHPLDARREIMVYLTISNETTSDSGSPTLLSLPADDDSLGAVDLGNGDQDLTPVPEPASLILMGSGVLTAAEFRRRKLTGRS
jgi:hypothetical protein